VTAFKKEISIKDEQYKTEKGQYEQKMALEVKKLKEQLEILRK
jgi:hypothetical protein